jgi:hypothetical protein
MTLEGFFSSIAAVCGLMFVVGSVMVIRVSLTIRSLEQNPLRAKDIMRVSPEGIRS